MNNIKHITDNVGEGGTLTHDTTSQAESSPENQDVTESNGKHNKIYCVDAETFLYGLEPGSIDLIVTSPPYDDLRLYNGYKFNFYEIAQGIWYATKQGGVVVWIVNDQTINGSESCTSARQKLYFKEIGFNIHDTMIYQKNGCSYPSQNRYYQIFEYMFILSKGSPKTVNLLRDRKNRWHGKKWSKKRSRRSRNGELKESAWTGSQSNEYGVRFNIWKYFTGHGYQDSDGLSKKHPASFPEQLAVDHILSWSNPGDMVCDPLMGSGTTAVAAILTGRDYIGCDVSEEYCNLAVERIRKAKEQMNFFGKTYTGN